MNDQENEVKTLRAKLNTAVKGIKYALQSEEERPIPNSVLIDELKEILTQIGVIEK